MCPKKGKNKTLNLINTKVFLLSIAYNKEEITKKLGNTW